MNAAVGITCLALAAGCAAETTDRALDESTEPPQWSFDSSMIFPREGSLARPEDGVALPDGRLIVTDMVHGLRRIEVDGTSAPFGEFAAAGYVHRPPERSGGANGVSLEPGGTHVLVADVIQGSIYRVDVATGATKRIYQHRYGVSAVRRDSRGTIWFTQSAHNTPEEGEARLWQALSQPVPEGALLRLRFENGRPAAEADIILDSLLFANGLALDESNGHLYLSETVSGRVLRYRVDFAL